MGDITLRAKCKTVEDGKVDELALYFNTGSSLTFIREDRAKGLGSVLTLPKPALFSALGNGKFLADAIVELHVELEGIWCRHLCYVAKEKDMDTEVLVGHDFMQKFNIKLDVKEMKVIIDRESLLRAQLIR